MKKTFLLVLAIIFTTIGVQSQNFAPTYSGIINHTSHYLTIHPFDVSYDDGTYARIFYDGNNKMLNFWNSSSSTDYTNIRVGVIDGNLSHRSGYLTIRAYDSTYDDGTSARLFYDGNNRTLNFWNSSSSTNFSNIKVGDIISSGNVGIGTNNPDEKLTVKGKIHSEEVRVDLNVPADYVFQKYFLGFSDLKSDYTMPSLEEVETFIEENHHLSGVPSAEEIIKEGLHLKEMTNLLLQKIEELTLYTIEQEKRINALEVQLQDKK